MTNGLPELKAALDPVRFAESLGVVPDPWQAEFLRSTSERILVNCSRQSGKSTCAALLSLHTALYEPGSLILILAPALRQAQELFQKLHGFYMDLGEPSKKFGERRLSLELANGSRIITLPGTERTVRGFSGTSLLVVDEASRVDDELVYAIRPMLAVSQGRLLMLSTPFGKRGVFWSEFTKGGPSWERYEVPASMVPRITEEFLEEEHEALGDYYYRQEYFCSFEDLPDQLFSHEVIEGMVSTNVEPLRF